MPIGCGATLISSQYALTAAHCMYRLGLLITPVNLSSVAMGEHYSSNFQNDAVRVSLSEIIPYPKYMCCDDDGNAHADGHSHYDIAILKLSSPVTFSQNIAPVCLPAHTMGNHAGKDAVITGWGRTETGHGSPVLKEANVTILTNKACNAAYGATDRFIR